MNRRAVVSGLLAGVLSLFAATSAGAQERSVPQLAGVPVVIQLSVLFSLQPAVGPSFSVDPAGPYEVEVGASEGAVVLTVLRKSSGKRVALTQYVARGVQTPERLQATFGKLGHVSMRFRESRHRPWFGKHRRCRGADRFVTRRGVFVGNFQFRGESDYLAIRAHRAEGAISSVAAKCRRHHRPSHAHSSSQSDETFSGLIATQRNGVNSTVFAGLSFRGRRVFLAQREESRGRMSVLRSAVVIGPGELPLNGTLTAGRFSPGTPFHGTGRYQAAPDGSTSWLGNLSVDFPGAPRSPLAGPAFEPFLEAGF